MDAKHRLITRTDCINFVLTISFQEPPNLTHEARIQLEKEGRNWLKLMINKVAVEVGCHRGGVDGVQCQEMSDLLCHIHATFTTGMNRRLYLTEQELNVSIGRIYFTRVVLRLVWPATVFHTPAACAGCVASAAKPVAVSRLWCAVPVKQRTFFLNVLKFNWVTGSPPKFDTLLASWYPTYMQSFIISHSSCAEQYGDMSADTQTHSHTNKPPTAGAQLVGHTSIKKIIC